MVQQSNKQYQIKIKDKQITIEQLPNGKFVKPNIVKQIAGSYGGAQFKPAVEVVLVCMKPLSEKTYVDQALSNGKGVTWLDDGRIPYQSESDIDLNPRNRQKIGWHERYAEPHQNNPNEKGRFPANLLVEGDVLNDGKTITKGNGVIKRSLPRKMGFKSDKFMGHMGKGELRDCSTIDNIGDSGSFSRYFSLDAWAEKTLPFLIVPKASKSEKGIDNNHPTVKPLKLMSYLITMGSRPNDTILDPFMGSGTTGIAALKLGRHFTGIELSKEYFEIAEKRISNTTFQPYLTQTKL